MSHKNLNVVKLSFVVICALCSIAIGLFSYSLINHPFEYTVYVGKLIIYIQIMDRFSNGFMVCSIELLIKKEVYKAADELIVVLNQSTMLSSLTFRIL